MSDEQEKDPIKEILDKMDPAKDKQESPKEVVKETVKEVVADPIESIAKERGWSKTQAAEHLALEQTRTAWDSVSSKHPDVDKYKDLMNKELSTYTPEMRRNPILIEKVYYMSKGVAMEKAAASKPAEERQPSGRRIAEPFPGRDSSQGGGDSSKDSKLSDEERRVAKFLRIDESSYEQSKGKKNLRDAVERKRDQGGNAADMALTSLTRRK